MSRLTALLSALAVVGCHYAARYRPLPPEQSISHFLEVDGPPVVAERYPYHLRFLSAGDQLFTRSEPLRADVSAHEYVLRKILRGSIPVHAPLEFHFMYAGHDSVHERLVLRYFARAAVPDRIAGWQVQVCYWTKHLLLAEAYVSEVPLE